MNEHDPARAPRPATEGANPRSAQLDRLGALEIVRLMNAEDATVPLAVEAALPAIAAAVDAIVARIRRGGRLIYVGAGTSGRIAMLDAVECAPTFSVPPSMVSAIVAGGEVALSRSVEEAEDDAGAACGEIAAREVGGSDVVVGVAASGRTPFVLAALQEARRRGALTIAVANDDRAPILDVTEHAIAAATGPELIAGSTRLKAGTAQKLICNMLTTATMVRLGKVHGNRMVDVAVGNAKLRGRAEGIVADLVGCPPQTAARLLDAADEEVKTAVLMGIDDIDAPTARRRLASVGGDLRSALGR